VLGGGGQLAAELVKGMRADLLQLAGGPSPAAAGAGWTGPDGAGLDEETRRAAGCDAVCRLDVARPELNMTWVEWASAVGSARAGGMLSDAGRRRMQVPGMKRRPTLQQVLDRCAGRTRPSRFLAPPPWLRGAPRQYGGRLTGRPPQEPGRAGGRLTGWPRRWDTEAWDLVHGLGSQGFPVACLRHVPTGIALELAPLHAAAGEFRYAPAGGGGERLARLVDRGLGVQEDAWLCPAAHRLLRARPGLLPVLYEDGIVLRWPADSPHPAPPLTPHPAPPLAPHPPHHHHLVSPAAAHGSAAAAATAEAGTVGDGEDADEAGRRWGVRVAGQVRGPGRDSETARAGIVRLG
jgi:hypothetical protein